MNDEGPLISVLIPCFNAERYVEDSLESVLSQTYKRIEVIVVDDGSADKSCEIVGGFRDRGVRLIRQESAGAAAARNRAFKASSGDFVMFLDADDVIGERHLAALIDRCQNSQRCVSMSQWDRFYTVRDEAEFPVRQSYHDDDGVSWLVSEFARARGMTQAGMFLIPRVLMDEFGLWNETCSFRDDFEFFFRIISKSQGVRFAPEARLYYRSGVPNSLSRRRDANAVCGAFAGLVLGTEHLIEAEDSARTRRVCANILQDFIYEYYPAYSSLRERARRKVEALGGADVEPDGPPGFQKLRGLLSWRIARRAQHAAEYLRLNRAARRSA